MREAIAGMDELTTSEIQRISDLLDRRESDNDEMAGYQAFRLMAKLWPTLTAENATLSRTVSRLQGVIKAILDDPHGCVFCDSGKLRNPSKDHTPECGFARAFACFPAEKQSCQV